MNKDNIMPAHFYDNLNFINDGVYYSQITRDLIPLFKFKSDALSLIDDNAYYKHIMEDIKNDRS